MRVLSAGDGVRYLMRTVAAGDGDRSLSTPLTRYYAEEGTPPRQWCHGVASTEIQARLLCVTVSMWVLRATDGEHAEHCV